MDAPTASLVSRSLVIIDHIAATLIGAVLSVPLILLYPSIGIVAGIGIVFLANLLYFIYFEGRDGQTPVKQRFGLVVVSRDGTEIGYRDAAIRNAVRLLEIPTIYLLGIGLATATRYSQRLGDLTASTVVIEPDEYGDEYRITGEDVSDRERVVGYLLGGIGLLPLAGIILHIQQAI